MMDKSILVTFSITRKPVEGDKPRNGGPFMAAFPSVAPVVLRYANLGKYSRVSATPSVSFAIHPWMTRVVSISVD